MPRLKLLFVAVVVAGLGAWYLWQRAEAADFRIRQDADDRLRSASGPVNSTLLQDAQAALASVKAAAQGNALGEAVETEGKPDTVTLEVARAALDRALSPEAERPVLIVVAAQGLAGRYRVGQSNRIDHDLSAFPPLSNPGALPRAGIDVLDGEPYRFAMAQFEGSKAPTAKGVLLVGFPIDDAFAQRLLIAAGVDISLIDSGKALGSTLPPADRQALQQVASNVTGAVSFGALSGDRFVISDLVPPLTPYLRLPLFVMGHRYRGRVLPPAGELSPEVKVIAAVKTSDGYGAIADEQRQILIGISTIFLLCVILALATRNAVRGLNRVVNAAERAVKGDKEARAPTDKMPSLVRRAAIAINALASQAESSAESQSPSQAPGLAEQLGIRPVRNTGSLVAIPQPSEADLGGAPSLGFGSSQPSPTTEPPIPYPSPSRKSNPALEPMVLPQKPKPMAAPVPYPVQPQSPESSGSYNPEATVIVQTPQAFARPAVPSPSPQRIPSQVPASPVSPVPLPSPFSAGAEDAHFQQVYREFVATKEKCGEPADGLTYDKFVAKLRKNQEQLIAKYACRAVRFQVYVKDGKTALKAQPIK